MALIKCSECGKEISDTATTCIHCGFHIEKELRCEEYGNVIKINDKNCSKCGFPTKKKKFSKKTIIISSVIVVGIVIIVIMGNILLSNNNKIVCSLQTTNNVSTLDFKITYTFSNNGNIKILKGHHYIKPNTEKVAEYLWTIINNQQEEYNHYEGMSYKATFSENKEITLDYSVDAEKAPTMFNVGTTVSGVKGITNLSTRKEIKTILEEEGYICN